MFARRRPLLRAAVVGGTAYAAGRHMGRQAEQRDYAEADQDQRIGDLEQQQYPPPPPQQQYAPPPQQAPAGPSMYDQLQQLSTLHDQGALTDDEFAAAKAKLLGT
jgi:putative oligomerization/nucleic acid binding protein